MLFVKQIVNDHHISPLNRYCRHVLYYINIYDHLCINWMHIVQKRISSTK